MNTLCKRGVLNASFFLFLTALLFQSPTLSGQSSKQDLENERLRLIKEIEETNGYLNKTRKNKESTIQDLRAVENKVANRKKLIGNIKEEIGTSEQLLQENTNNKDSLGHVLEELEEQYSAILRVSYLQKISTNKWMYLLSSDNMKTFLLRWRYMDQFRGYEQKKEDEIAFIRNQLEESSIKLSAIQDERQELLLAEEDQVSSLQGELESKDKMVKSFADKEKELKKELDKKKSQREKLNLEIEKIILAQLKALEEKSDEEENTLSTEIVKLSSDFTKNKTKFPWPISSGFISLKFGTQPHPTIKGIDIENNGIDISSTGTQAITSIFSGEVVGLAKIPGYQNMIIVKHGEYYSVYSNINSVNVKKGDKIDAGQKLGVIVPEKENRSELHFEIWKDKTKLNPEKWLRK